MSRACTLEWLRGVGGSFHTIKRSHYEKKWKFKVEKGADGLFVVF